MKKNFKKLVALMGVVCLGASMIGCSTGNTTKETTAKESTGAKETTADGTASEGTEKYAVVLKVLSSPFWQSMKSGIEEKAKELGVEVDILAANSEDDVEGQVSVAENLVSKGYSGIAVAPLSADNLVNTIVAANEKGILVANIDEKVNIESLEAAGGSLVSFVTTDNRAIGKMAGEYIAEQVKEGEVAIIEGKAGNASGEDRKAGAKEAFEAAGLKIVDSQPADWDRTKAYDLATNLISKNENLKAIYCANDTMAMGAQEAVENSGKDIIVVGTDGNEDAVQSVKDGKLTATIGQDSAKVGARSLELLVEAARAGQKPGDVPMVDEKIDAILITKESAE
jgi:D-allose transport system substrate-binding protein